MLEQETRLRRTPIKHRRESHLGWLFQQRIERIVGGGQVRAACADSRWIIDQGAPGRHIGKQLRVPGQRADPAVARLRVLRLGTDISRPDAIRYCRELAAVRIIDGTVRIGLRAIAAHYPEAAQVIRIDWRGDRTTNGEGTTHTAKGIVFHVPLLGEVEHLADRFHGGRVGEVHGWWVGAEVQRNTTISGHENQQVCAARTLRDKRRALFDVSFQDLERLFEGVNRPTSVRRGQPGLSEFFAVVLEQRRHEHDGQRPRFILALKLG